jgi:hypothetical protein
MPQRQRLVARLVLFGERHAGQPEVAQRIADDLAPRGAGAGERRAVGERLVGAEQRL